MSRVTGPIIALDLGISTGFAVGCPGGAVTSGSVRLKKPSETIDIAEGNLIAFLCDQFSTNLPELLVKERIMSLEAFKTMNMGQGVVYAHAGYHGIVQGLCVRFGVKWLDVPDSTARKHFVGKGRLGDRRSTKDAVIQRCHVLNLMPRDCLDEDRADAICIHDYSCANFGGRAASIQNFQLFEQQPRGRQNAAGT